MTPENVKRVLLESPVHGPAVVQELRRLRGLKDLTKEDRQSLTAVFGFDAGVEQGRADAVKLAESEFERGKAERTAQNNELSVRARRLELALGAALDLLKEEDRHRIFGMAYDRAP